MLVDNQEERNDPPKKGESAYEPAARTEENESSSDLPPSYTSSASSSTTPSALLPPPLPSALLTASRSSHVSLSATNHSVNTTHIIDLNIPVPTAALPHPPTQHELVLLPDGSPSSERVNGYWQSTNGSIKARIGVKGKEGEEGKRIRLVARSTNGSVRLEVLSRLPLLTPLSFTIHSNNGSANVFLPRSFQGPITHRTGHGSIKISPGLQPFYTRISTEKGYIGDVTKWDGTLGEEKWGVGGLDECECSSGNGSVRVAFAEEEEDGALKGEGGWFGVGGKDKGDGSGKKGGGVFGFLGL